jgi:hypothetical protein
VAILRYSSYLQVVNPTIFAMYQYTQVQYIKRKDYYDVIIYYSRNGAKFRPPTGVKVLSKHLTKSGTISSGHPGLDEDLRKIKEVQERVEDLAISYKEKYGEKPPVEWLEKEFEKPTEQIRTDLQELLCHWDNYIEEKQQTVRSKKTVDRINNVRYTLNSFKQTKNYNLAFNQLGQRFFNDLIGYMIKEHKHFRNKHERDLTSGNIPVVGLNNDTTIKRLKDFTEYLKYCIVEKDVNINLEKIKKYIKLAKLKQEVRPLSKSQKWEITLTPDEIQYAVNLHHFEPEYWKSLSENQKKYLDVFLFMCLQGTAPIDTKDVGKSDIKNGKIIKDRSKSGTEFKVELDPIAEEILVRYNYQLNFTEQTLNDELKKMFVTIFELYRKHYEEKNDEPYQIIYTQKTKKGDQEFLKIQHKGLFIELMSGRRSFLTNLAEKASELGIKEAMDKAGHVLISTTLGYIHQRQQVKKNQGSLFGVHKLT